MSIAKRYTTKSLYFSERITDAMDRIFDHPLTIVEAPMGYGKTTAVREYLNNTGANVLWQRVNDSSTNNYWHGFSRLFGKLDDDRSQSLVQLGFPNDSVSSQEALNIIEDIELPAQTVLVVDDYHLIDSSDVNSFIEFLVRNEIDNLHIVLTARFTELQNLEELRLKGYLHHITKETFELRPKEIIKYYRLCGISLKDTVADKLYSFTEGWISALYLLMLNYIKEGNFTTIVNIYKLVEKAVYTPFSEEIQDFLLTLCIFDSFTFEQASHMWQKENAGKLLTEITNKNAFIKYDVRTKTYQIHNIFTNFLNDVLESKHVKNKLYRRAAHWFLKTGDYTEAMHYFHLCKDFDKLLLTLEEEKSKSINVEYNKELLIKYFEECPAEVKAKHPFALLIFAIRLFSLNEMVLFGKACGEFIRNLQRDESLKDDLRKRLLGEYELLMSFTNYNDITKMSEQHQKAGNLLSGISSLIYSNGSWTFGSPSVLYMFYRETGKLERHVQDLIEALSYYYKLTVTRLAGLSRVDTALAVAKANYSGTLSNVILATADNYPDALAGSVLAYKLNAPILLVGSSDADQVKVLNYMKSNLDPAGTVYILGGTAVVSSAMEGKVTASGFANITRLGGTNRYETSVKIAEQLKVKTGTPIVLAYGENYPDALSISSMAAEMQYPILLVQKDGLSDTIKNEIAAIKPTKVYIIGGTGVISSTVDSQVAQITSLANTNIVRIAGADRYETSLAVAQYFNLSGQSVCIATGNNFPDALAGSVYAANHNAPIILADGNLSDQVMNYLKGKKLTGATLFGGEAVVSKGIEQQLGQLMGK